ncbi:MAG: endonuclease [Bacteroidota bacterium]
MKTTLIIALLICFPFTFFFTEKQYVSPSHSSPSYSRPSAKPYEEPVKRANPAQNFQFPASGNFIMNIFNDPDPIAGQLNTSENRANLDSIKIKSQNVSIVFWNVENLYDPYDDTTKLDDEYTTAGAKHWNYSKFSIKLNHIAKTLLAIGRWEAPAIIGLCEIENRYVLNKLIYETPLKSWKYKIIHHDSPDLRGVDVAMLYRPDLFRVISTRFIPIRFPFDTLSQTREILMVKGAIFRGDSLVMFVNHWPSRRGGYLASQPRRDWVASVLRGLVDSVQAGTGDANILIMGDFNDEPGCNSLENILSASRDTSVLDLKSLYNLMGINNLGHLDGTLKFRDQWSTFDQFIVSGWLMAGLSGLKAGARNARVYKSTFLLEDDNTYFGKKLNRSYSGPRYHGGFSDHLPVVVELSHTQR